MNTPPPGQAQGPHIRTPLPLSLMNFANQMGEWERPASCRDKGRTWEWAGALCLSWSPHDSVRFCGSPRQMRYPPPGQAQGPLVPTGEAAFPAFSWCDEDKHKAPSSTPSRPLSLQVRRRFRPFPDSVVKVHQGRGGVSCHYCIRSSKFIIGLYGWPGTPVCINVGRLEGVAGEHR